MIANENGFVYNYKTKEMITEFYKGDKIYTSQGVFFGTKSEALLFGLIFKEE